MSDSGYIITEDILLAAVAAELAVSPDDVDIKSFAVTAGSNKGDNYACELKAVEVAAVVKEEERKLFYMVKCLPMNEVKAKMMMEFDIFLIEIDMLTKIIPALRKLDSRLSAPTTFYADASKGVIVMEDLKKQDYFLVDKVKGLEVGQIKLVLEQLALLHATSYHYCETYPNGGITKFKEDYPHLNGPNLFNVKLEGSDMIKQYEDMMSKQDELFNAIIKEHCPDRPQLIQKLKKFSEVRVAKLNDLHRVKGNFNCMLHNDAWCNNFLFCKNEAGVIDKIKILDFQGSRRGRPTVDLAYFLGSSSKPEFRKHHLEEMLQFYHTKLGEKLESLGHDKSVYPYEQMKKDYIECYPFGYCMSQMHTMMHLTPSDNAEATMDFDEIMKDSESLAKMMARFREGQLKLARTNETIRNRLIMIALEAEEMGFI